MPDNNYIPNADAEAQAWANNFLTVANANLSALGLTAGDTTTRRRVKSRTLTAVNRVQNGRRYSRG